LDCFGTTVFTSTSGSISLNYRLLSSGEITQGLLSPLLTRRIQEQLFRRLCRTVPSHSATMQRRVDHTRLENALNTLLESAAKTDMRLNAIAERLDGIEKTMPPRSRSLKLRHDLEKRMPPQAA